MPGQLTVARVFVGVRSRGDARVWVQTRSSMFPLAPHLEVRSHSPDGFEWGYGGSGPAQLALAICLELLEDRERALRVYQDVKWRFIGRLEADTWELQGSDVLAYINELENRYAAQLARRLEQEAIDRESGALNHAHEDARVRQAEGDATGVDNEPT